MDPDKSASWETTLRRAVLAGDEAAWRTVYDRCFDPLFAYVHRRCGRDALWTEEVVQECWMIAVRRIRTFDPRRGSLEGWLAGIAGNVLRNHWRLRRRQRERQGARAEEAALAGAEPTHSGMELAEQIAMAMATLPGRYRAVLRAKYEEELSVSEIAERRRETTKSVESLLSRARAAFRHVYRRLEGN